MPRPKRPICATAVAVLLSGGIAVGLGASALAQEAGRSRERDRERDRLIELRRSVEPRSSDPSEGERREERDQDDALAGNGGRAEGADGDRERTAYDAAERDPDAEETAERQAERDIRIEPEPDALADPEAQETDARVDREPEIGPYDPLGVRVGSFLIFPEVGAGALFTDNVFESSRIRRSDQALVITPGISFRSNWSRHSFSGEADAELIRYKEFSSEDENNIDAALRGRIDVSRRTNIEGEVAFELEQESRGSINVPDAAAETPDEETTSAALQVNHRINRVTLSLGGEVVKEEFEDVALLGGGTFDNAQRDNTERELTGRVAREFQPGVAVFLEGSVNEIEFTNPVPPGGVSRDSDGYEAIVGVSLEIGGKITGEIGVGYAKQTPKSAFLHELDGVILNGNLTWRATGLTTLRFTAQSDVDTTTVVNSVGSLNQTVELAVEHALRRNVILGAALEYEIDDFGAANIEEHELTGTLSAEYRLNRSLALTAAYIYTDFNRTGNGDDYNENEFLVGVQMRR